MIMISRPSKPIERTAKGTTKRRATIRIYEPDIEALYASFSYSVFTEDIAAASFRGPESLTFVRELVHRIAMRPLGDDEDIFQHGCDRCVSTLS